MKLTVQIAATARELLGRDPIAPKRGCNPDWDAWDAIVTAARRHGLRERFGSYVTRAPTLRGMARDYVARYTQAYGPVDGVIDVSRGRSAPKTSTQTGRRYEQATRHRAEDGAQAT